jgi:hypothetical protein
MAICHRRFYFSQSLHECFFCNYEFCAADLIRCAGCGQMFCVAHVNAHKCSQILLQRSFIEDQMEISR